MSAIYLVCGTKARGIYSGLRYVSYIRAGEVFIEPRYLIDLSSIISFAVRVLPLMGA